MHDRVRGVGFERLFQRLNRQVQPAAALVAPAQRQANVNVLRLELGRLAEQRHGLDKVVHRPQGLPAEKQDVGLQAAGILDAVERRQHAAGQRVAGVRRQGIRSPKTVIRSR